MNYQTIDYLVRINDLVDSGKLPEKGAFARLFWVGHKTKHLYELDRSKHILKCVACDTEQGDQGKLICIACGASDTELFRINHCWEAEWQCLFCNHEWRSEDGEVCPSCNRKYNV